MGNRQFDGPVLDDDEIGFDAREVRLDNLDEGRDYTFTLTSTNSEGPSTAS